MVHFAAGILPITWAHDGTLLFLIGQDVRDASWSDFGGKCEKADRGDAVATACREFFEETYGCLLGVKELWQRMHPSNYILLKSKTQNGHPYYMFLVEVPFAPHLRNAFLKTLAFLRYKEMHRVYVEKTDVQWVTLESMRAPALHKRSVFANTIDTHEAILDRLNALPPGVSWATVCAALSRTAGPAASPRLQAATTPETPETPETSHAPHAPHTSHTSHETDSA